MTKHRLLAICIAILSVINTYSQENYWEASREDGSYWLTTNTLWRDYNNSPEDACLQIGIGYEYYDEIGEFLPIAMFRLLRMGMEKYPFSELKYYKPLRVKINEKIVVVESVKKEMIVISELKSVQTILNELSKNSVSITIYGEATVDWLTYINFSYHIYQTGKSFTDAYKRMVKTANSVKGSSSTKNVCKNLLSWSAAQNHNKVLTEAKKKGLGNWKNDDGTVFLYEEQGCYELRAYNQRGYVLSYYAYDEKYANQIENALGYAYGYKCTRQDFSKDFKGKKYSVDRLLQQFGKPDIIRWTGPRGYTYFSVLY